MRAGVSGARALMKMSELSERSGVSAGTIRHYLREGLLGSGEGRGQDLPQHGLTRPSTCSGSS